jgi:hypothetical protein
MALDRKDAWTWPKIDFNGVFAGALHVHVHVHSGVHQTVPEAAPEATIRRPIHSATVTVTAFPRAL